MSTLPGLFCTSSQANALWRGEPVSADTITEDKLVLKTVMLASASLETQGEGREVKKRPNAFCHSKITSREDGILFF